MSARKSLAIPRAQAFKAQGGRCFYCHLPMWQANPEHFAARHGLTVEQVARLQCTGEHLVPHKDGGGAGSSNIVAACWFCNQGRHRLGPDTTVAQFKRAVSRQMGNGGWHRESLHRLKG